MRKLSGERERLASEYVPGLCTVSRTGKNFRCAEFQDSQGQSSNAGETTRGLQSLRDGIADSCMDAGASNEASQALSECSGELLACADERQSMNIEPNPHVAINNAREETYQSMPAREVARIFTLTEDEIKFLQACYNDSSCEGHFSHLFDEVNFEACENSLIQKGLLTS